MNREEAQERFDDAASSEWSDTEGRLKELCRDLIAALPTREQAARREEVAAETWHKAFDAWIKASRHGTKEDADSAAISIILGGQGG